MKENERRWGDQKGDKQSCGRIGSEDAARQSRGIRPVTKRSVIMWIDWWGFTSVSYGLQRALETA